MAKSVPIVSLWGPTSLLGRDVLPAVVNGNETPPASADIVRQLGTLFRPICGKSVICGSSDDYVYLAMRLIDDAGFRATTGATFRALFDLLYSNERLMADLFLEHIVDIVQNHGLLAGSGLATDTTARHYESTA